MQCKYLYSWILHTTAILSRATQSCGAHFNHVLLQLHEDMSVNHIYSMCRLAHIYIYDVRHSTQNPYATAVSCS